MPSKKLFISHASADKPFVNRLVARLREACVDVWYDTFDVDAATEDLHERFRAGVADADFLAIVLTPRSQASQWVSYEADIAMQQHKPILAIVADAPRGHYDFLRNPHLNDLLRGGRRVVVDFTTDFERGLDQLLVVVAPEIGREREIERNLRTILDADDPDVAEAAMTEAGLHPGEYLPRLSANLPDLRDNGRNAYRVERAMTYLGEPALDLLFSFLLRLVDLTSAPIPSEIPHTSDGDGGHVYKGDAFTDVLRHMILTGGNRAWAAQIGAQRCLVAAAKRDVRVRTALQTRLQSTLEEVLKIVTVRKHDGEFTDAFFDALRLTIETVGLIEEGKAVADPWTIEQFATTKLWGSDSAENAKNKLTSYVVPSLARIGSREALIALLRLAEDDEIQKLYFTYARGTNPWEWCFAAFGNGAVDAMIPWIADERDAFRRCGLLNLAAVSNVRGLRAVLDAIAHPRPTESTHGRARIALAAAGRGIPEICDRIIHDFDPAKTGESDFENAVALAAIHATDKAVVAELCLRLAPSTDSWTTWYVIDAVATQQLYSQYDWLHAVRRDAGTAVLRGRAAIALAEVRAIDVPRLKAQLESAEPVTERPYVAVALAKLGDASAIDGLVDGLKASFLRQNAAEHEVFAGALSLLNSDAAIAARSKWYQRI